MKSILFIPPGRRYSLINSFITNSAFRLLGADTTSFVPTRKILDEFYTVPPWKRKNAFLNAISGIVAKENIDCIIPLMDEAANLIFNSDIKDRTKVLGCSSGVDYDKLKTERFITSLGLKCPPRVELNPGLKIKPFVARPRTGTGAGGVYFIDSWADRSCFLFKEGWAVDDGQYVFNKYIKGTEYTVDCFKDIEGNLLCVIPRQRIEVRGGEVQKARTVIHPKVIEEAAKIAKELDFIGPMCCQCIEDNNGDLYWLEINARFGGGTPLSIAAGAKVVAWVEDIINHRTSKSLHNFIELYMCRADQEIYYGEA